MLYTVCIVGNTQNLNLRKKKWEGTQSVSKMDITLFIADTNDNTFYRAKAVIRRLTNHTMKLAYTLQSRIQTLAGTKLLLF